MHLQKGVKNKVRRSEVRITRNLRKTNNSEGAADNISDKRRYKKAKITLI